MAVIDPMGMLLTDKFFERYDTTMVSVMGWLTSNDGTIEIPERALET